ncbi:MAG: hypothetical protein ABIL09_26845, partial [Gemmatimonadota bacterium]
MGKQTKRPGRKAPAKGTPHAAARRRPSSRGAGTARRRPGPAPRPARPRPPAGGRRPNVVGFFTDQQRWGPVGLHGNPLGLTPHF